ncbi:endonuclease domain-containing protein [Streptomyces sp. NPDC058955]
MPRSDSGLFLPKAYAELLNRWEQAAEGLVGRARICSRSRAQGPRWGAWRTPSPLGYITLCPPCSGATFQRYTGHLRGVLYESPRRRRTRADEYLCRMCAETRASVWDHCHDHGYVRGPLCASCNTYEGKSTAPHTPSCGSRRAPRCTCWSAAAAWNGGPCPPDTTPPSPGGCIWRRPSATSSVPAAVGVSRTSRTPNLTKACTTSN